jgi:hypothetical protein
LLPLGNDSPSGLFPHNGNICSLLLAWSCLVVLVGFWGRKARCLVTQVVLLLLLRELSLVLLLVLMLMLMLALVTLLELLRWVA